MNRRDPLPSPNPRPPRFEELLLVALGAVPGALFRWLLHRDPLANLLGCLLIGLVAGLQPPRPRLMLLVGIGFCGALTTFGGWIAALATALRQGAFPTMGWLLMEMLAGVAAVAAGRAAVRRRWRPPAAADRRAFRR